MNIPNSWYCVGQAIKEANRLKQKSIYTMPYTSYMVVRDKDEYVVEMFSYASRDKAIKSNSLLLVI
jgi:hypothetical protein